MRYADVYAEWAGQRACVYVLVGDAINARLWATLAAMFAHRA